MYDHTSERERLRRRLGLLTKELSKQLRNYRQKISSDAAIARRGDRKIAVYSNKGSYAEGADVVRLCHEFLDGHKIPADREPADPYTSTT